jgi:hypothetical protein
MRSTSGIFSIVTQASIGHNPHTLTLLIGPLVAFCGVLAAVIVIHGRAGTRRNLYASLRADRERRIQEARERALAPVRRPTGQLPALASRPGRAAVTAGGASPALAADPSPMALPGAQTPSWPWLTPAPANSTSPGSETSPPTPARAEPETGELKPGPTLAMTLLSYTGLVAALVVVLLGVFLMIEAASR